MINLNTRCTKCGKSLREIFSLPSLADKMLLALVDKAKADSYPEVCTCDHEFPQDKEKGPNERRD